MAGFPTEYTFHFDTNGTTVSVDADLDNIRVKEFPRIEFAEVAFRVKEFPKLTFDSNVAVTQLPELNLRVRELPEIKSSSKVDIAITQLPDTRVHLPANYSIGLSVLGVCLVNLSLCGEAQVITEKYVPRRMEIC